ncbi:MAG: conjugal transfer protein TraH [Bacteroidales bacterium]|nr:conjugal transfer protein TraH [Bacteroidales bacterium]
MAIDADLIRSCADPGLEPAVVEKFIKAAGSSDPLTITVRSGNRIVLVPPAKTPEEALTVIRKHVGQAVVRVGVTQYPAGLGIKDPSELSPDLFDPCKNIQMGTALFAKLWRIVWKWYGNPTNESVMPQVFDDAIEAWKQGQFEGMAVFTAPDPGGSPVISMTSATNDVTPEAPPPAPQPPEPGAVDPNKANIRIDLSGIGGRRP